MSQVDPRVLRIERDHALLGLAAVGGAAALATPTEALNLGAGWALVAISLWAWRRIGAMAFAGEPGDEPSPAAATGLAFRVVFKSAATLAGVAVLFRLLDFRPLPFILGTAILLVACLAEAARLLRQVPPPSTATADESPAAS